MASNSSDPCQSLVDAVNAAQAVVNAAQLALTAAQVALSLCRSINPQPTPIEGGSVGNQS